ncbi:segregation/condensation protein A [Haloarchaeobius iranensis]|uniref:Condensin subunit ScpA n=1 Tax=Haloarchaeobius iranensis TaxID=996166 RepID=A0A1G9WX50_9EURY|nr:segregation/condensation protein A [Haloarchaeobius iranensis]SDM88999.1 condensin subunit ScpA [Haloarchaeobius iranensis]
MTDGDSATESSDGSGDRASDEQRGEPANGNDGSPTRNGDSAEQDGDSPKGNGDSVEDMLTIAGHEDRTPPGEEPDFLDDGGDGGGNPADPDEFYGDGDVEDVLPDEDDEEASDDDAAADDELDAVLPDEEVIDDAADDEVEPVELLVQLAKKGEIDPWDIDIMRVTDRFLDALESVDLRTSGRALFYASVLLRMKGDELIHGSDEQEEEEPAPWEQPFGDAPQSPPDPEFDPIEGLEAEMERRLERKHARGTPETLDELVRDLREAERGSWWKEGREYDTSDSPKGFRRGTQTLDYHAGDDRRVDDEPTEDDVTGTTHEEEIEEVIDDVRTALREHYDAGRAEVLFAEIQDSGGSRVLTFLALLFLAHRGQVTLQQDELFGDLWVQDSTAASVSDEAVAD